MIQLIDVNSLAPIHRLGLNEGKVLLSRKGWSQPCENKNKHSVSYYYVASLSHQIPILLQDSTPYVVPEIWENTLPLFNPGQYTCKRRILIQVCCGQLWVWHMICGQTCDGLYHFVFYLVNLGIPYGSRTIRPTLARHTGVQVPVVPAKVITWSFLTNNKARSVWALVYSKSWFSFILNSCQYWLAWI